MVAAVMSDSAEYVDAFITPTLKPALIALCKEKPQDPVTFLAKWLEANKPPPPAFSVTDAFKEAATHVFYLADEDGSGSLEFEELYTIAASSDEAEQILVHLDKDKDGVISEEEWVGFFGTLFEINRPMAEALLERSVHMIFERDFMLTVRKLFDVFDADSSGVLEMREVMVMMGDDNDGAAFLKYADGDENKSVDFFEWSAFWLGFWRSAPGVARGNIGYLMQRAAELASMPAMPPPPPPTE